MFDHVTLRTADAARTARLLTPALAALRQEPEGGRFAQWDDFGYREGEPQTRNVHVGLLAPTTRDVAAFWQAGVDAGLKSDGPPGPRTQYGPGYYGGFLLDPEGNSIEACTHPNVDRTHPPRLVDHVWLRVRDLAASRAFYEAIAPFSRFEIAHEEPGYVRFRGPKATLSLVEGTPVSEHLHLAFPVDGAENGATVLDPDGHNVELVHHDRR